jgi:hypothetical protein
MVAPLGVTLAHWAPRAVCSAASIFWQHVAVPLHAPRVASCAALLLVDGALVATHIGVDSAAAPALCETTTVKLVAETSAHVDVHVAHAALEGEAEIVVDVLAEGIIKPLKWRRAAVVPLSSAQRVVSVGDMHCETAWRVHVPVASCHARALAAYRLRIRGVAGSLTRVNLGRVRFPNGPFAAEIRAAQMCVRVPNADIFFNRAPACVAHRPAPEARGVLRIPIEAPLVIVRYLAPVSFSHIDVAAAYSVKALLCDGSVVTVTPEECGCSRDAGAVALAYTLADVVELRFHASEARLECAGTIGAPLVPQPDAPTLRVVREPDGGVALVACAPIIVG